MKKIVIYASKHHGNTKKLAEVIGRTWDAPVMSVKEWNPSTLEDYDLVAFGSGIYSMKIHRQLEKKINDLPDQQGKKAVYFLTSGFDTPRNKEYFDAVLERKNFDVLGGYRTLGWNTFGPLFFVGGANRGRPNEADLEEVEQFALKMLDKTKDGERSE